jgi:hypothetical protein
LVQTHRWELLGLLLTLGASAFGLIYVTPDLASLTLGPRATLTFSIGADAAVGLAGLVLTVLGSLAAIVISQLKAPGSNIGAALLVWTDFIALVLGDVLFYGGYSGGTDVLVGLVSAALTVAVLMVISGRGRAGAQPG